MSFFLLQVYATGGDPDSVAGEFGRHSLYKMLGYFSLVGLLRLHSLLGDYYQAIKVGVHNINSELFKYFVETTLSRFSFAFIGPGKHWATQKVTILPCACLPNLHFLLCGICLHDDASLLWCYPHVVFSAVVPSAYQTAILFSFLPERPD